MALGGLDVGTSSCKFVVFHADGRSVCESKREYRAYGADGIREIHPGEVWNAVVEVLNEAARNCPVPIEGFAVTSLGESFVAVDADGTILNASMVTGDKRGILEKEELAARFGKGHLMELTGVPASEMYGLPKMMWTNRNTDIFKRARYLFMYEDYIAWRLTGKRVISYSSASRSMAFDIRAKGWSKKLLAEAGLAEEMMSRPAESGRLIGTVTEEMSKITGLSDRTILAVGGHDQMCAALGSGVLNSRVCGDGMGTCEVMTAYLDRIHTDQTMMDCELACVPYISDDTYLTYAVLPNCGILMNWFRDTFLNDSFLSEDIRKLNRFELLDDRSPDRPTGLLVIPDFGSSGNPHVDYEAKGTIWGLTVHTAVGDIYRGVKEGMAYHMKLCLECFHKAGIVPEEMRVSGGGAVSDATLQLRADVFGMPVCRMEHAQAGVKGCAVLAGAGLGIFGNIEEVAGRMSRTEKVFYPDTRNYRQYEELYERYKKLYETLDVFDSKKETKSC